MEQSHDDHRLTVRIPKDIEEWLRKQAKRNASSMSSEIVRVLRTYIDSKDTANGCQ